jgi:hypothetical protein
MNSSGREEDVIQVARRLRGLLLKRGRPLSESELDTEFIFRFDPKWCERVRAIRVMTAALVDEPRDMPLTFEAAALVADYLEENPGIELEMTIGPDVPVFDRFRVKTLRGNYRPLDSMNLPKIGKRRAPLEIEQPLEERWYEALHTQNIQSELTKLARDYDLVPSMRERDDYSVNQLRAMAQRVVGWVLWGVSVPTFHWPLIRLIERPFGGGQARYIQPMRWISMGDPGWTDIGIPAGESWTTYFAPPKYSKRKKPMSSEVRIKAWCVYYLSHRGGGQRTEEAAVDLWNVQFDDNLKTRNYQTQRDALLANGSKATSNRLR